MINRTGTKHDYPDEFKHEGHKMGYGRKEFDYSKIQLIERDDLNNEQIHRIKELYEQDFINYYPEEHH